MAIASARWLGCRSAPMEERTLNAAAKMGHDSLRAARRGFAASARSSTKMGRVLQPMPQDLELRDRAREMLIRYPEGSPHTNVFRQPDLGRRIDDRAYAQGRRGTCRRTSPLACPNAGRCRSRKACQPGGHDTEPRSGSKRRPAVKKSRRPARRRPDQSGSSWPGSTAMSSRGSGRPRGFTAPGPTRPVPSEMMPRCPVGLLFQTSNSTAPQVRSLESGCLGRSSP